MEGQVGAIAGLVSQEFFTSSLTPRYLSAQVVWDGEPAALSFSAVSRAYASPADE